MKILLFMLEESGMKFGGNCWEPSFKSRDEDDKEEAALHRNVLPACWKHSSLHILGYLDMKTFHASVFRNV